ncbi:MAG TPA: hypothetical protein VFU02_18075 [Polyangiaceae bacterium]|nr:hypothetical protein [Polyangiaceae bacterium]
MNVQVLIDSIVQQVTVLIAQLATSGGVRAPLAHVANQVFLDLANELETQGVSRKVSADMFGMALRAYIRKVRRLSESESHQGRTLWQAVLEFIKGEQLASRERILERFRLDGSLEVSAVLHDLSETGLVFCSGTGRRAVYRAASDEELGQLAQLYKDDAGAEELAWVLVYRHGPIAVGELAQHLRRDETQTALVVDKLRSSGRVQISEGGLLTARDFVIPLGAEIGWEASVFDHVQAVVQTICQRLQQNSLGASDADVVGGSTYSFDIWPGHPLEAEVKRQLNDFRKRASELRRRVEEHNREHGVRHEYQQVVHYAGQCLLERGPLEQELETKQGE